MQTKKWYQSITIWFNVALLLVAFVPELNKVVALPSQVLEIVALVGNLLLRFKTVMGISPVLP